MWQSSAVHLTQLCLPHLAKQRGNIVNVSSVAGLRPVGLGRRSSSSLIQNTLFGMYGLTKAALDQFTRSLAYEVGHMGVRVNSVK